ncbi:MAG TPA: EboA domain-containing protein [Sphingobacteriaceae bacterium]|nr:EboA domain-containing protein [Sphingobacteriaceae bacterium]
MMYSFDITKLNELISAIIRANVTIDAMNWLKRSVVDQNSISGFNLSFAALPKKSGKAVLDITNAQIKECLAIRPGFLVEEWTTDRLCRVWFLMQTDASEKDNYFRKIDNLFLSAEMNEQVALYSSLPVLAYPEIWIKRCAEGIRSNIDSVLESIMYFNSYPAENLEEPAWNQMILKAFFTNKKVERIAGLDLRANNELAHILSEYAKERWAAGRMVNPMLWRLVGKFIDEQLLSNLTQGLETRDETEKKAMVLALSESSYGPAKKLLEDPKLKALVSHSLSWESFETV